MRRTMTAYRLVEWEAPPRLVETEVPSPGPGEVLVRVAGNGLCHSDVGMAQIPASIGELLGWSMPFTLGHEVGGWVEEAGDGVELAPGTPVAVVSPHSCGRCEFCVRGLDSACTDASAGRGYGRDGGLASHVLVSSTRALIPLRTLDPVVAGPLTDAGATSYHAVKRALPKLGPGSTAVVLGAGGLGSFAVQFLRALSPARVVAVDPSPTRRDFAAELGAHEVVDGVDDGTAAALAELTGGRGAEAVLDFVGVDATIATGLGAVRTAGAFALVGAGGGTFRRPWYGGLPKEADIYTFQGSTIADVRDVVALAEAGQIRSEVERFPLADVAAAYERLERGELRGRAVVIPTD